MESFVEFLLHELGDAQRLEISKNYDRNLEVKLFQPKAGRSIRDCEDPSDWVSASRQLSQRQLDTAPEVLLATLQDLVEELSDRTD